MAHQDLPAHLALPARHFQADQVLVNIHLDQEMICRWVFNSNIVVVWLYWQCDSSMVIVTELAEKLIAAQR